MKEEKPTYLKQPLKGVIAVVMEFVNFIFIALWMWLMKVSMTDAFAYTIAAFPWCWMLGFTFAGWPATKITKNWFAVGTIQQIIQWFITWLAFAIVTLFVPTATLADYGFLWGPNGVFAFALLYFWFENALNAKAGFAGKQPIDGVLNTVLELLFIPVVLLITGFNIPFVWFPLTCFVALFLESWPFHKAESVGARGVYRMGFVFFFTACYWWITAKLGIPFTSLEGSMFTVILTCFALIMPWAFNMWPFGRLKQPTKGIASVILCCVYSIIAYYLTIWWIIPHFGITVFDALVYWTEFLITTVIIPAPGMYNWWLKGYEASPLGA